MDIDSEKYANVVHKLARWGCFSLGLVYCMIGGLAIASLLGRAEDAADEERIIHILLELPFGAAIIWLLIAGLIGYILWRVFEALTDPYEFGKDISGLGKRTGVAMSGFAYGAMGYSAYNVVISGSGNVETGELEQQLLVSQVLNWWAGEWIIGAVGIITLAVGIVQFKYVIEGAYQKRLDVDHLTDFQKKAIKILAYSGYFARGIILFVLGYFFIVAAINSDPGAIGDTDTAFDFIGGGIIGDSLFFVVACGTIAFGILMFLFGTYYKFRTE